MGQTRSNKNYTNQASIFTVQHCGYEAEIPNSLYYAVKPFYIGQLETETNMFLEVMRSAKYVAR